MAHSVSLSWVASTDTVDGYNIYRGSAAGAETTQIASLVSGVSFLDTTPAVGEDFYVVKSSRNGAESVASNEVSVVLLPAAPTNLVATVN